MASLAKYVPAFVLGIIIGLAAAAWPLTFERKVDVSDLLSLLVSVALFLCLNILFVNQQGRKRDQREHLVELAKGAISAARDLDAVLRDVQPLLLLGDPARLQIQGSFQHYSNSVYLLCRALEMRNLYDKVGAAKLRQDEQEYRELVLGDPFPERYEATQVRQQKGRHKTVCEHILEIIFSVSEL